MFNLKEFLEMNKKKINNQKTKLKYLLNSF